MTDAKDNFYGNIERIAEALERIGTILGNVAWERYPDAMDND